MNGLKNDNYLATFVVKWIAAIIHWCWRQDDKMNYYTVFFWYCPQSNFKKSVWKFMIFKYLIMDLLKQAKDDLCIPAFASGRERCAVDSWLLQHWQERLLDLRNSPKLWDLGFEFCRAQGWNFWAPSAQDFCPKCKPSSPSPQEPISELGHE